MAAKVLQTALFSRRARTHRLPGWRKDGESDIRIGARAFLHLGGLCEPEPAKRSWLFPHNARKRLATVSVLVWKWNVGRREAAIGLPCVCALTNCARRPRKSLWICARL